MYYLRVKWHFIWTLFKDIIGKRGRVETRWANVNSWRWATGLWKLILLLFCFSVWDFSQQSLTYLLVRFSFLSSAKKLVISLTVSHKGLFISFFFFFWPWCLAWAGSYLPHQGSNPVSPTGEAQNLNHWITRKISLFSTLLLRHIIMFNYLGIHYLKINCCLKIREWSTRNRYVPGIKWCTKQTCLPQWFTGRYVIERVGAQHPSERATAGQEWRGLGTVGTSSEQVMKTTFGTGNP